ncbi:MAG: hypothetical protein OEU36_04085 [Gammaproteobacteria bacterium]|nr:hypothetical protein [Gammaproteobacteria bacterium]
MSDCAKGECYAEETDQGEVGMMLAFDDLEVTTYHRARGIRIKWELEKAYGEIDSQR